MGVENSDAVATEATNTTQYKKGEIMLRNLFKSSGESREESDAEGNQENWFNRLKSGLTKTRNQLMSQLSGTPPNW